MNIMETLSAIPLFSELRTSDIERLASAVYECSYAKNSVILFKDDSVESLYVVISGQVKAVLSAEDGREVILSLRGGGDFFGEMSLIDDGPLSMTVIATEDAQLFVLHREDFKRCLQDIPQIATGLLRSLVKRLRQADSKISSLVLLDVSGRVAKLLIEMADENDGINITQRVTHHMIAQMIGSSRETVSRTIREFSEQNLVEVVRKTITMPNRRDTIAKQRLNIIQMPYRTISIRDREALEIIGGHV